MATQPRLFYHWADVERPDGTVAQWSVLVTARRLYDIPGQYDLRVEVHRHRGTFVYERIRVFNDAPCTPASRSWGVYDVPEAMAAFGRITRPDGYDFGSLRAAVWTIVERAILATMTQTFAREGRIWCHPVRSITDPTVSPLYRAAPLPGVAPATLARASEEDQR